MPDTKKTLTLMLAILVAILAVIVLLLQPLQQAFLANPVFNGMILSVLVIGIFVNLRQVIVLGPEIQWIDAFRDKRTDYLEPPQRGLLTTMGRLLLRRRDAKGGEQLALSTMSMRSMLDTIRYRLDESRDTSRYLAGLLIFLGLLGTFWGLLDTLRSVSTVLDGLRIEGQAGDIFGQLKEGLEQPLAGMGTAFSSSLFGLAGALVVGFFDLQAGHAQNRFYNGLEEWLSDQTQVGGPAGGGDGEASVPVYIQALLEQTADSLDKLQRVMSRSEEEHRATDNKMTRLADQLAELVDQMRGEQRNLLNLTKSHGELVPTLERLNASLATGQDLQEDVRTHLRNVDGHLNLLVKDLPMSRAQTVDELRDEIRLLARTLSKHD